MGVILSSSIGMIGMIMNSCKGHSQPIWYDNGNLRGFV